MFPDAVGILCSGVLGGREVISAVKIEDVAALCRNESSNCVARSLALKGYRPHLARRELLDPFDQLFAVNRLADITVHAGA